MSMLLLICTCGQKMKVPDTYLGKTGACPKCKKRIPITEKNTRPIPGGQSQGEKPEHKKSGGNGNGDGKKRIGELLIDAEIITQEQLNKALDVQKKTGGKTGEILVSLGYIDVKTFADFLAKQPGIASIDLSNYEISRDLLVIVPNEFARKHDVFPLDRLGNLLTVGMACPLDSKTIKELEDLTKLRVKALLCALDDIKAVISRYYGDSKEQPPPESPEALKHLEGILKLENVAVLIQQVGALPTLPDTIRRVQKAMSDPDVSIQDVVEIVQTDPPVAAKILSVANSAAYGFPNRVDSVSLAATLLGLHETYMLVLSSAVVNTFEKSKHFDYRRFWNEAMACAHLATNIARSCGQARNTGVFAAALLHDIGRIALWEAAPQRYARVGADLKGPALIAAEQDALSIAHPEAGFELASNWGLPIEIAEPIRFHHDFHLADKAKFITATVAVASTVTDNLMGMERNEEEVLAQCAEPLAFLGLDFGTVIAMAQKHALDDLIRRDAEPE